MPADAPLFRRFGRLMQATAGLTLLLVFVGVVVRATGSGLGCGTAGGWHDWPLCHGQLIPPAAVDSLIEFSHRALAAVVALCVLGALSWAASCSALRERLGAGVGLAAGLLVLQIALGALTVRLLHEQQINPAFVVAHLGTAFAFFAMVVVLGMRASRLAGPGQSPAAPSGGLLPLALATPVAVFFQAVLGGLVANLGASMACPEFPSCAGGVWIPALTGTIGLQVWHRIAAVLVTGLVVALFVAARNHPGPLRGLSGAALALVLVQFTLGVLTVLLGLPLMARALHHVVAYALFGTTVAAAFASLTPHRASEGGPAVAAAG